MLAALSCMLIVGSPTTDAVAALESSQLYQAEKLARVALAGELTPHEQDQVRLVRLSALARMGRYRDALPLIETLEREGPAMGTYLESMKVAGHVYGRQCEQAQALTEALAESSVYGWVSWSRVANCWMRLRDPERALQAVDLYEGESPSDYRWAAATVLRAKIYETTGERRKARDLYREVTVRYPHSSAGRTAVARIDTYKRRGWKIKDPKPDELLQLADLERSRQRPTPAKALYNEVQSRTKRRWATWQSAELGLAEIEMVHRSYRRALKRIDSIARSSKHPDVKARALYLKGDVLSRRGRVTESLRAYDRLLEELPDQPFASEAALSAAKLSYGARRLDQSRAYAEWLLQSDQRYESSVVGDDGVHRTPADSGAARDHALWLLAWIERRSGGLDEVMDSYLAKIDITGAYGPDALYWRARLALESGDKEAAVVFAAVLKDAAPTSFSALAVTDLLNEAAPERDISLDVPSLAESMPREYDKPLATPADLLGPMVLFEHGLRQTARNTLRQIPVYDLSMKDRIAAAWLYRRSGELHIGTMLARRAAQRSHEEINDPVLLELAYPRPFGDIVEHNAEHYEVPIDLIYAVIREESAFNPRAVSPRYARGLMQMIRPTAKRMAADAKVKRFRQRQLYEPEMSIKLGTHYLATLLEMFDGNLVAAVASYHAGEDAVARWLKTRGHLSPDEFIEDIPYTSTRRYVKKVLSSYGVYRLLYQPEQSAAIGLDAEVAQARTPPGDSLARLP